MQAIPRSMFDTDITATFPIMRRTATSDGLIDRMPIRVIPLPRDTVSLLRGGRLALVGRVIAFRAIDVSPLIRHVFPTDTILVSRMVELAIQFRFNTNRSSIQHGFRRSMVIRTIPTSRRKEFPMSIAIGCFQ